MTREEAEVRLKVYTDSAQKKLDELDAQAKQLRDDFKNAFKKGDTAEISRISKELDGVNKQISKMQTNAAKVKAAMTSIDKATPKELQKTIKLIMAELNSGRVQRGSKEWNEYTAKLRAVKAELREVNAEMQAQEGVFSKLNNTFTKWGASAAAAVAGLTGIVLTGREAVKSYAEMQAEEANVRKYTGMTADQVEALNKEFKRMDTRTSREELNKLAQEAGRLGKTSIEDVLGFVRAADQINVALDELGDGATLTLSKLTNIFGDEERLGTERSLFAVGSVINELSQNCTASAPYLADFAKRLAGVGNQAHMTIPEIMALASVLDSQGQAVEMSATAVGQLITKMFKDPAKIAKAAGMDVKVFTDTLKKDTNEALVLLLDTLGKKGGLDALAPVFADMGADGARASGVISALSGNVDMLRKQIIEANNAFADATSVSKEYQVQNTTVQAELDKARKRFNELAVELGKELVPVMKHAISSARLTLEVMKSLIDFIIKYKSEILIAATGLGVYTTALKLHNSWTVITTTSTKLLAATTTKLNGIWAATKNLLSPLTFAFKYLANGLNVTYSMQENLRKSIKATSFTGWLTLLTVIGSAIALLVSHFNKATRAQRDFKEVSQQASETIGKEKSEIEILNAAVHDNNRSLAERQKALKTLKSIVKDYHADLTTEGQLINDNTDAIDNYIKAIQRQALVEAVKSKLGTYEAQKLEKNIQLKQVKDELSALDNDTSFGAGVKRVLKRKKMVDLQLEIGMLDIDKQKLLDYAEVQSSEIAEAITEDIKTKTTPETITPKGRQLSDKERKKQERERKKAEAEERKRFKESLEQAKAEKKSLLAVNESEYRTGEKNYYDFSESKFQIERDFIDKCKKLYEDRNETESAGYKDLIALEEKLKSNEFDYFKQKDGTARAIETTHRDNENSIMNDFYDPNSKTFQNQEALHQALLKEDLRYLEAKKSLYSVGSKEYLQIVEQMDNLVADDQMRRRREMAERYKNYKETFDAVSVIREQYAKEKSELDKLHEAGLISEEKYQKALNELKRKFRAQEFDELAKFGNEFSDMVLNLTETMTNLFEDFDLKNLGDALNASLAIMSAGMESFSNYASAAQSLELANLDKRYDAEVKAAGKNQRRLKLIEEKKAAEEAKLKKKYNDKAMKMEIAQAVAQTAMAALNAYTSAVKVSFWLGPVAAAMATAFGAVQIATIKKQHEAQAAGYYTGGFTTKSPDNRKEVGVVHANEFVANHQAVNNPALSPILRLIDTAQKSNTVGSLTAADVSNAIGQGVGRIPTTVGSSQTANVDAVNSGLEMIAGVTAETQQVLNRLSRNLEDGIRADVVMDGPNGFDRQWNRYNQMKNRAKS